MDGHHWHLIRENETLGNHQPTAKQFFHCLAHGHPGLGSESRSPTCRSPTVGWIVVQAGHLHCHLSRQRQGFPWNGTVSSSMPATSRILPDRVDPHSPACGRHRTKPTKVRYRSDTVDDVGTRTRPIVLHRFTAAFTSAAYPTYSLHTISSNLVSTSQLVKSRSTPTRATLYPST
jgi:hypothetical protein